MKTDITKKAVRCAIYTRKSVTEGLEQEFNSMGRLTLNILLSFAQFEREIISERTRDKVVAAGAGDADALLHLRESAAAMEAKLAAILNEQQRLQDSQLDDRAILAALAEFDPLWENMAPRERARSAVRTGCDCAGGGGGLGEAAGEVGTNSALADKPCRYHCRCAR